MWSVLIYSYLIIYTILHCKDNNYIYYNDEKDNAINISKYNKKFNIYNNIHNSDNDRNNNNNNDNDRSNNKNNND